MLYDMLYESVGNIQLVYVSNSRFPLQCTGAFAFVSIFSQAGDLIHLFNHWSDILEDSDLIGLAQPLFHHLHLLEKANPNQDICQVM